MPQTVLSCHPANPTLVNVVFRLERVGEESQYYGTVPNLIYLRPEKILTTISQ